MKPVTKVDGQIRSFAIELDMLGVSGLLLPKLAVSYCSFCSKSYILFVFIKNGMFI